MGLFGDTNTPPPPVFPTPTPAPTYVGVQPFDMNATEWSLKAIVLYVILRDFFMFFVPMAVTGVSQWVHASFPKTEQLITEQLDEAAEKVVESVSGSIASAASGTLAHVEEELLDAASKGSAGLVERLVGELS
jgi:hypothetical protein